MPDTEKKPNALAALVAFALAVALALNLADAIWDPSGTAWNTLRKVSGAVFGVLLIAYLIRKGSQRKSHRPG